MRRGGGRDEEGGRGGSVGPAYCPRWVGKPGAGMRGKAGGLLPATTRGRQLGCWARGPGQAPAGGSLSRPARRGGRGVRRRGGHVTAAACWPRARGAAGRRGVQACRTAPAGPLAASTPPAQPRTTGSRPAGAAAPHVAAAAAELLAVVAQHQAKAHVVDAHALRQQPRLARARKHLAGAGACGGGQRGGRGVVGGGGAELCGAGGTRQMRGRTRPAASPSARPATCLPATQGRPTHAVTTSTSTHPSGARPMSAHRRLLATSHPSSSTHPPTHPPGQSAAPGPCRSRR